MWAAFFVRANGGCELTHARVVLWTMLDTDRHRAP